MYNTLIQEYQGEFGNGRTVEEIVSWVEGLPAMPDVVMRALKLVDDPNSTPEELAGVINRDPALASLILRSANSVSAGQQQQVTTLSAAIGVVGMLRIKTVLLGSALRNWNGKFGPVEKLVWEKSLGAASAAQVICEMLKKKYREELHLNGLLHNLGQIILLSHKELGSNYGAVLDRIRNRQEDFSTAERAVIGFSYPLVGALVAKKWGLPDSTCRTILRHADPFEGIDGLEDEKLAVLKLALGVSQNACLGCPPGYPVDFDEMAALAQALGFGEEELSQSLNACTVETKARFKTESEAYA